MKSILNNFKFNIGDKINTFGRNLIILDRKYIEKTENIKGKPCIKHQKYYKYKCLNCGNEDWILEYLIDGKQHCGCNACCHPPRKLVVGINDITTTAPWMIKYFPNGKSDAQKYFKNSKDKVNMICPDCGRQHITTPMNVYAAKNLTCPCQDGWSYPNKFMYSLLEQLGVDFEAEKTFDWSEGRIYDDYIECNGLKIITEQHGKQHYDRQISSTRTVEEEKENDKLKQDLALSNGITNYIVINASKSDLDYLKNSIIDSGLLDIFKIDESQINWLKCHEFATSNFVKILCNYKNEHNDMTLHEISNKLHISYKTVQHNVKVGNELGWCTYEPFEDMKLHNIRGDKITNQRPIYCISDGKYYRCSNLFVSKYEEEYGKRLSARNIRSVCLGKRNHVNNLKFKYITQEEFNTVKSQFPDLVIGEFFTLKTA